VPSKTLNILFALCLAIAASTLHGSGILPGAGHQESPDQTQVKAGPFDRAISWIWTQQRKFHRRLTSELSGLAGKEGSALWLVLVSFLYGIFHAAGPGHGKAVLTTYLLTHGRELRRGVAMASATALMQGTTAVVLVYGLILAADWLPRETRSAVDWTERLSFLLVAAIGLYLLYNGLRGVMSSLRKSHPAEHSGDTLDQPDTIQPAEIKKARTWGAVLGVVFAVGLRPCSGAVLILIFAHVMHIHWAGIAAVAAMSIGTAITVSTLALLAVNARHWALAFTEHSSPKWWRVGGGVMVLLGGALVFAVGLSLLIYSFDQQHPLGL
jgi:ABC-type nickel/cobalt efflux system permease component RcnA